MLKNLKIKNVALIREADIEFNTGLNVLSGETGSGKSVVLDSLNFALAMSSPLALRLPRWCLAGYANVLMLILIC